MFTYWLLDLRHTWSLKHCSYWF